MKANLDATENQYKSYGAVRRGLLDPSEAGFENRAVFEAMDRKLSTQLNDIKVKLENAQEELKDLVMDRQYLLKAGVDKVDTLADYKSIRSALKKNRTFDYVKYGDDLMDTIAGMEAQDIALQRAFYKVGSKADWSKLTPKSVFKDGAISDVRLSLQVQNIEYKAVSELKGTLTTDEIISKLGGGDLTEGSCSSLAFSYAGNKVGLDVTDYRGGDSRYFFSLNSRIREIADLPNVVSFIEENTNDIKCATSLLKKMEKGKEYYLATGKHAAIVRVTDNGYEYLELQTVDRNGFKELTTERLRRRFGCQKSHSISGRKFAVKSELIDISSLEDNTEFQKILGYMNTDSSKQKKGGGGYAK